MAWDEDHAKRLGAAIRRLRHERGLSQEAVAFPAGVTHNQFQLIENGKQSSRMGSVSPSNPRFATITGIAEVLGVSVAELLAEAGL